MKKIKILHIWWSGGIGGAERFIRDILVYSNSAKFEHCVCFLSTGGPTADQIMENGGQVFLLGMKNGLDILNGFKLMKLLRKFSPNIVHMHGRTYFVNFLLFLCGQAVGKIYFEHGGDLIGNSNKKDKLFYALFGGMFDLVLVNSEYVKSVVVSCLKDASHKVKLFYIGIDVNRYSNEVDSSQLGRDVGIPTCVKVVGVVGRLVDAKGIDDFIRVAAEIRKERNDVCFVVVGDGNKRQDLEKYTKSIGIDILFLGERGDVSQLLKLFDVFLFTSKWEPFGIVLLESLLAHVPVVGFDIPGANEVLSKGGGVLIRNRDIKEVAKSIIEILDDAAMWKRISNEGYANVCKHFNIKNAMQELELLYEALSQKKELKV